MVATKCKIIETLFLFAFHSYPPCRRGSTIMVESHVEMVTVSGGVVAATADLAATTTMGALSEFLLELLLRRDKIRTQWLVKHFHPPSRFLTSLYLLYLRCKWRI